MSRPSAFLLSVILLGACGPDAVTTGPTPSPSAQGGGAADGGGPPATPGTRIREVLTRNPFGSNPRDHFYDGDLELSASPDWGTGQVGWLGLTNDSVETIPLETGGLCRSGLRCGVLRRGVTAFAKGSAAANEASMVASVWVKPPAESVCRVADITLVDCDTYTNLRRLSSEKLPDENGWCEFGATLKGRASGVCLYLENTLPNGSAEMLVDSALLLPEAEAQPMKQRGEYWAPDEAFITRLERARRALRRHHLSAPSHRPEELPH